MTKDQSTSDARQYAAFATALAEEALRKENPLYTPMPGLEGLGHYAGARPAANTEKSWQIGA